jgi:hypothetical protein
LSFDGNIREWVVSFALPSLATDTSASTVTIGSIFTVTSASCSTESTLFPSSFLQAPCFTQKAADLSEALFYIWPKPSPTVHAVLKADRSSSFRQCWVGAKLLKTISNSHHLRYYAVRYQYYAALDALTTVTFLRNKRTLKKFPRHPLSFLPVQHHLQFAAEQLSCIGILISKLMLFSAACATFSHHLLP